MSSNRNRNGQQHILSAILGSVAIMFFSFPLTLCAGGYVDGKSTLNPAQSIKGVGGATIKPTFANDQFNDKMLVGTVNNDPIKTPSTADPVSTVSGNNYHDETDLTIKGREGLNYVFTRTYNSAPVSTGVNKGMGFGWTHSYNMRIKSNDFGDCPNCNSTQRPENANSKTSSITYTDERGGEQNFLVNETNYAVTSPKGVYDTLTLDSPVAGQHILTFRNGTQYVFETPTGNLKTTPGIVARLKAIIAPSGGMQLNFGYDSVGVTGKLTSVTDNIGIFGRTGLTLHYYSNGNLKDITDWTGRAWNYVYDANNNLIGVTNPLTHTHTYTYPEPANHLLKDIIKPLQRDGQNVVTTFEYYENGRTFQQTNSFAVGDTLDYDLYRKSTRVTDARGGIREYFYDDSGRMTKLKEPDGAILQFENQVDGVRTQKTDALGYATRYSYALDKSFIVAPNTASSNTFGQVSREQDALGRNIDYSYGPFDQLATVTDKRGTITTTAFGAATSGCDYLNKPKQITLNVLSGVNNVLMKSFCWTAGGYLDSQRQYLLPGNTTRYLESKYIYQPGSNGLLVQQQITTGYPSGIAITKTYTYDSLARVKTETLKRRTSPTNAALIDLTTSYDYDALDRVTKITDPLGNEVINNYDANGQLWKVTHRYKKPDTSFDVRDVVARTYDAADRVKTETDAAGKFTTYNYDEAGNVIAITDAEGHTKHYKYDEMNRRTDVEDATGYTTVTHYDQAGKVKSITNANGETITFEYDAVGNKTAMVDAKQYRTEYQYDANGNLTCVIDANAQAGLKPKNTNGCTEYRQYDELNRAKLVMDAMNGQTITTYDLLGNRLSIQDAELKTWTFAYDDLGRLSSETDHALKTSSYATDEAGNVYQKTNRLNEISRFTYDNGNRLTRVDYLKDNSWETFGYDAAGNRNAAANSALSYGFVYDNLNRLTSKTDSRGKSLIFTYDNVGNMLTKTTYQGSTTTYVYDNANRLMQLRNPDYTQVDYQYDPAGRLLSRVMASGAHTNYEVDANGWGKRLTQYDAANTLLSDATYTRDRVGNITQVVDSSGTTTYGYDADYRLLTSDLPSAVSDELFTYDKVGNRKTYTNGALTANSNTRYYNYFSGTNKLQEIRIGSTSGTLESSLNYDFEGSLLTQTGVGAKTLTWDAKGRMKTLAQSGITETYNYDAMDYRISRTGGTLGALNYYLEGEHLESVYDSNGLREKYFRGASMDELVAGYLKDTDNKLKPYLFHHDSVTSVTQVTGHNGGTLQALTYSPFGSVLTSTGASPNRLKYTGREDDGTGLYYYRARYYDPQLGRFLSEDKLGFRAGINFYVYVNNRPTFANDPTGNVLETAWDVANVGLGAYSLQDNLRNNRYGWAALDAVGLVYDTAAVAVPFLPAGVAAGLSSYRAGNSIVNSAQVGWDVTHVANVANDATKVTNLGRASEYGSQAHREVGAILDEGSMLSPGANNYFKGANKATGPQPDLSWSTSPGVWLDLTTKGEWAKHVNKYSDDFGIGIPLIYDAGRGLTNFSPLVSGAGVGIFAAQQASDYANGGFLLYPNKANTNMMQSVYKK